MTKHAEERRYRHQRHGLLISKNDILQTLTLAQHYLQTRLDHNMIKDETEIKVYNSKLQYFIILIMIHT